MVEGCGFKSAFGALRAAQFALRGPTEFQSATGLFKFGRQGFFRRQCQPVFGGEDFVVEPGQRIAGDGVVFLGAEDQADGRVFAGARPVFAGVVQIQVHPVR